MELANKLIVIYGLGEKTKALLEKYREYNIVGLLDSYLHEGELYGKKILSLQDVQHLGVDVIIIAARTSSTKIIYRKIADFCKVNGIKVYDQRENELSVDNANQNGGNSDDSISIEDLLNKINQYEIISFDIFDTLVTRNVLYPTDVIELLGKDQDFVIRRLEKGKSGIIPLDVIYKRMNLPSMLQKEIMLEEKLIVRREKMVEVFEYAVAAGKEVYLISDMHLGKATLQKILKNLNIYGYKDIFVSCDHGMKKENGLFRVFRENVKGNSYLHIGDDQEADGEAAKNCGIESFIIKKGIDLLEMSPYKHLLKYSSNLSERLCLGKFIANIFNDPFCFYKYNGKITMENISEFIAPSILNFVFWFKSRVNKDDSVLFLARDGYLIEKIYNLFSDVPEERYFYMSRTLGVVAALFTKEDIIAAIKMPFSGSDELLLKKRFFLAEDKIIPYDSERFHSKQEYILAHQDEILLQAERVRTNFLTYVSSLELNTKKEIVFFDFVASGTCQSCFEKIIGKKVKGLYCIYVNDKKQSNIRGMYEGTISELDNGIYNNYFFLETILKSLMPSIKCFDDQGEVVYLEDIRDAREKQVIEGIQERIVAYAKWYLDITTDMNLLKCRNLSNEILNLLGERYSIINDDRLKNLCNRDEFCNRSEKNLI